MSIDPAAEDGEGPELVTFIRMQAEDTLHGQERVMTKAAYNLQCRATSHSASCGHPGYVPDDYLEHLDGLGIETTITAPELCAIGTWERGGGYCVLDWEAVGYALDGVRQCSGEDAQALAEERDHEASVWTHIAKPIVASPPCAACGASATRIELVAPASCPSAGTSGSGTVQTRTVVSAVPRHRRLQRVRRPHRRQPGLGESSRRSGLPSASLRSTWPGSMTMPGSARTATFPTASLADHNGRRPRCCARYGRRCHDKSRPSRLRCVGWVPCVTLDVDAIN
jgi:hypothetical protein